MRNRQIGRAFFVLSVAAAALYAGPASAQVAAPQHYELSGQALGSALRSVSVLSGQAIVAPSDLVAGKTSRPLVGTYSAEDAVARLLDGSGLVAVRVGNALVIRRQSAESAQDAQGNAEGVGDEAILVTGTRIRGRAPAGASVITIDRKAIADTGYATSQQVLQALPQNFGGGANESTALTGRGNAEANATSGSAINLRGLGASSTLVLLDGERPPMAGLNGIFVDLSMIPISAIERIEILADGASALYGSDAVAGVVNIVPRKNFRGIEASGRIGFGDGFREAQFSALAGAGGSRGNFVIGYEFYRRTALAAADRPYFSEDLRRYGLGDYRTGASVPGTITAGGRTFAILAGQDGTALAAAQLVPGAAQPSDIWAGSDVLPAQRRHALFASGRFAPSDGLEFYVQGLFGRRDFDRHERLGYNAVTATVPVTNPFYVDPIGTHQPVQVRYDFRKELGAEYTHGRAQGFGSTGGLRWSPGAWQVDLHATYGEQDENSVYDNLVNSARVAAALADTSRATALNLFGDGTANNPATLAAIRGSYGFGNHYAMFAQQLRADGLLFRWSAGDVRLAIGAEHRRERYFSLSERDDRTVLRPVLVPAKVNGLRHVSAAYAELSVPLSGKDGGGLGIGALDVSAAVRGERYTGFGDTVNPKVGVSWTPVSILRVRGSWGTSFRAPSFQDMRQDASSVQYFAYPFPDPASPTGTTNALVLSGNDPNIGPERATSWTAGLDLRHDRTSGPSLQLTYFDIDYRDRIANPAANLFSFFTNRAVYAPLISTTIDPAQVAAYFASPYYARYSNLAPGDVTAILNARNQNLAEQRQRGLDFDLAYRHEVAGGRAEIGVAGTYPFRFSQQITATSPAIDLVGKIGFPSDLRLRGRAQYDADRFGGALFVNYVDGYTNNSKPVFAHVKSWTTLDLELHYRISKFRIALTASNLLDADPPHTAYGLSTTTLGFDVENANPLGRVIGIQVSRQW